MPTPGAERPIQRVPSGLPGPGGTGRKPCAQGDGGGYHHGSRCFVTISNVPDGVGYRDWPVATPKRRTSRVPSKRRSVFAPRSITITGPNWARVTRGATVDSGSSIGG